MKLCWALLFLVFSAALWLTFYYYPLSGVYTIVAPAKLFDLLGANLVTEPRSEADRAQVVVGNHFYYYIIPFWVCVNGVVAWLLSKLIVGQFNKRKKVTYE
ncbi:hypothetical protein [Kangiella spongicola]|uniref:Uncharacterized protein n=1 Tax=Kangiella spongicola TaxID=796379 RepID=A0A318DDZ1_9GAMM|nr:hypothetical protein [Kangiella spongicola]PXF64349.1 hypothetical protein DL796_04205 [Kangiella spongicola]